MTWLQQLVVGSDVIVCDPCGDFIVEQVAAVHPITQRLVVGRHQYSLITGRQIRRLPLPASKLLPAAPSNLAMVRQGYPPALS